ncbi:MULTISPECIES: hypothetical protein [Clostridium]|uniref:hypothetical protein n=1 Tax=Clostridium TaxID=1485 RepID=UPI000AE87EE2|nr:MULTISPECIES: hypothetical protein [Clostridium]
MLFIETNVGNFAKFQDIFQFMKEENLKEIEVTKVEYCLDEIIGKGIYTIEQIEKIVNK